MIRRFAKAVTAQATGRIIAACGNIFLVPLYLTYWSPALYGEWLALWALAGYLATVDFGMNMAAVNRLTNAYTRSSFEEYARCQHSALAFYIFIAVCGTALLGVVVWLFPVTTWMGLQVMGETYSAWVLWLVGAGVLCGLPVGFICATYRTTGDLATSQWVGNTQQVLNVLITAMLIVMGGGAVAIATSNLFTLMLVAVYVMWDVRRRFPSLAPSCSLASRHELGRLVSPSALFGLIMTSVAVTQHGTVLIVSAFFGGLGAAVFVTTRTLINVGRLLASAAGNALWPEMTAMEAKGEWSHLRELHRVLVVTSCVVSVVAAGTLWFNGTEVLTLWTRGRVRPDAWLLRAFLGMFIFQSPWLVSLLFTASTNRHRNLAWAYVASSFAGVGMAIIVSAAGIGMWAIPVSLMLGEALFCYHFVVKDTCEMLREPYRQFAASMWPILVGMFAATLALSWCVNALVSAPLPVRLVLSALGSITVSLTVTWTIWLNDIDRTAVRQRLRRLIAPTPASGMAA